MGNLYPFQVLYSCILSFQMMVKNRSFSIQFLFNALSAGDPTRLHHDVGVRKA